MMCNKLIAFTATFKPCDMKCLNMKIQCQKTISKKSDLKGRKNVQH